MTKVEGEIEREVKRVKVQGTEPKPQQCHYYLKKKNRYCGSQKTKGQLYCAQHAMTEATTNSDKKRIPCPLDPKHSVWEYDLKKHMQKCNAKPKPQEEIDPWCKPNINSKLSNEANFEPTEVENLGDDEMFKKYIDIVLSIEFPDLQYKISNHAGLNKRINEKGHIKHPIQQSSLMGNLKTLGLLNGESFYVEFGCGKGELSRFLNSCVQDDMVKNDSFNSSHYGFGLIDRAVNRMKNDPKIIKETEEFNKQHDCSIDVKVKRTRIDIKDLDLDIFLDDCNVSNMVGISKHLCGVATDLTLKLIINSNLNHKFGGLLIAMCCRHVCQYDQLLIPSKQYLKSKGIGHERAFKCLTRMCSWAVSGTRLETLETDDTGLNGQQKKSLGITARRLLDESRVYAIKQLLPDYHVEIFWYVKPDVTLENVCLSITRI